MVEKGARGALYVLDVPFPVFVPEFAVPAADDFALEADGGGRGLVGVGRHGLVVALRVATDANDFIAVGQGAGDGAKGQGRSGGAGIVVGCKANGGRSVCVRARGSRSGSISTICFRGRGAVFIV